MNWVENSKLDDTCSGLKLLENYQFRRNIEVKYYKYPRQLKNDERKAVRSKAKKF